MNISCLNVPSFSTQHTRALFYSRGLHSTCREIARLLSSCTGWCLLGRLTSWDFRLESIICCLWASYPQISSPILLLLLTIFCGFSLLCNAPIVLEREVKLVSIRAKVCRNAGGGVGVRQFSLLDNQELNIKCKEPKETKLIFWE